MFTAVVVVVLVLIQLLLPRIAVYVMREKVKPYGHLESAHISAFPAIELLWGKADSVTANATNLKVPLAKVIKLGWEARGVRNVDMRVGSLSVDAPALPNGMVLRDVYMRKRGPRLSMQARLTESDLDAATPNGLRIRPLPAPEGQLLVQASGGLFGATASVDALVTASEGKLVVQPQGLPFAGFARLTLFSNSHLRLEAVSSRQIAGQPGSWLLEMSASLR